MEDACYTRETALEKAIQMESASFEGFKRAYFTVRDPLAKDLLRDLALDELKHKYTLEKALFEDLLHLHESGVKQGPSMQFSLLFQEKPLQADASEQEVTVFAIHEKKRAIDFYASMAKQCLSAPMEEIFLGLAEDERGHLVRLEEFYETNFLKEM